MSERGEPRDRDPSGTIGRNLEPFLLMELLRAPSYGYDLIRRLDDYGFRRAVSEPAVVYKVLRSLEETGSIASEWSTKGSGPARRYYELTEAGRDLLRRRVRHLSRYRDRIDQLLQDYTALTNEDPAAGPAAEELALAEPVGARARRAAE
jgi:DNA-binding PadR family transcriptional regulator